MHPIGGSRYDARSPPALTAVTMTVPLQRSLFRSTPKPTVKDPAEDACTVLTSFAAPARSVTRTSSPAVKFAPCARAGTSPARRIVGKAAGDDGAAVARPAAIAAEAASRATGTSAERITDTVPAGAPPVWSGQAVRPYRDVRFVTVIALSATVAVLAASSAARRPRSASVATSSVVRARQWDCESRVPLRRSGGDDDEQRYRVIRFLLRPGTYVVRSLRTSMAGSFAGRTVRVTKGRLRSPTSRAIQRFASTRRRRRRCRQRASARRRDSSSGRAARRTPSRSRAPRPARGASGTRPGCTQRSMATCLRDGCRYWPIVTTSTPWARSSRIVSTISSFDSPSPAMMPVFVSTG